MQKIDTNSNLRVFAQSSLNKPNCSNGGASSYDQALESYKNWGEINQIALTVALLRMIKH